MPFERGEIFSQRAFLILQILAICKSNTIIYIPSVICLTCNGDSPRCGEMSRSDKIGSLVKGAVTAGDWGIKKQNTIYLKLIYPYKIPAACLRQPTSLYKGGRIPQSCLDGDTHSFAREVKGARREKFNRYFLSYVFFWTASRSFSTYYYDILQKSS